HTRFSRDWSSDVCSSDLQKLRIDGYAGDPRDSEGVLGLIVCDFVDSDEVQTFGKGDVPPILNPLIRFLKKARTEEFRDALNEVKIGRASCRESEVIA